MRKSFFCRQKSTFEKASRPVSRVLFFRQPSILVRCCQRHRATFSRRNEQPHGLCLSCFGWGLQGPATLPPQRWALTPPFHPYRNAFGGLFLLHYPWSRLHRTLSGTLPWEARTFLTCGLSTLAAAIIRQTYVPYHITFIFKCKLFYYPTLKQLPPINSRSMEFCGTFSLLDPRKYPRNLIRYLAVSYSGWSSLTEKSSGSAYCFKIASS